MERTYFPLKEMLFNMLGQPGIDEVYDTVSVSDSFVTRETANNETFDDDSTATLQKLVGVNTLSTDSVPTKIVSDNGAKNLVINGDFSEGITGWTITGSEMYTVLDNVLTLTGADYDDVYGFRQDLVEKPVQGHKYLVTAMIKSSETRGTFEFQSFDYVQQEKIYIRQSDDFAEYSIIYTATQDTNYRIRFESFWHNMTISVKNIKACDITAYVNAGKTDEQIKNILDSRDTYEYSELPIPAEIQALPGYGVEGNIVDFENKTYTQNKEIVDGVLNTLGTPIVTDISAYTTSNTYRAWNGGTETFDCDNAPYSEIDYMLKSGVNSYDNKLKAFDNNRFQAYDVDELQLEKLMEIFNDGFSTRMLTVADDSIVKRLWSDYIIPACWDCEVAFADDYDEDTATVYDTYYRFFAQMCAWITQTAVNRITVIEYYEDYKTELMSEIKQITETSSAFNDTPQGIEDYTDDAHTTNTNKGTSTTSNDFTTVSARLSEVNTVYENLFIKWANEFVIRFSL